MKKSLLSHLVQYLRLKTKKLLTAFVTKAFRSQSYKLFGIPHKIISIEQADSTKTIIHSGYLATRAFLQKEGPLHKVWPVKEKIHSSAIFSLSDAMVSSSGVPLTSSGKILSSGFTPIEDKKIYEDSIFYFSMKKFLPKIVKISDPVASLTQGWQDNFYHWMHEVLPKIALFREKPLAFRYFFVETKYDFQKQSLALLNIKEEEILPAEHYETIRVPHLWISSFPEVRNSPPLWACQFLRNHFLPLCKTRERRKRRIYLSRADAASRRIINEKEVLEALAPFDFEKVILSTLSLEEQIRTFHEAEIVIAPHGAGLSHIVFCDPQTSILEIFYPKFPLPSYRVIPCYWKIACNMQLNYFYLFGEKTEEKQDDPDILVNVPKLIKILKGMPKHVV